MDKKVERIINIYNRIVEGEVINKADEAERFQVNERSIQRDIDDIRESLFMTEVKKATYWCKTKRKILRTVRSLLFARYCLKVGHWLRKRCIQL